MYKSVVCAVVLGLSTALAWADKPEWAGQGGGKPSDQQIDDHRNAMRDKNDDKAGKKDQDRDQEQDRDREKTEKKSKDKNKNKDRYPDD